MGTKKPDVENNIKISELITALRRDLLESQVKKGEKPIFRISGATIEIEAVASKEISAGGKVNIYVTTLGADAKETSGARCKMAISLDPLSDDEVFLRGAEAE